MNPGGQWQPGAQYGVEKLRTEPPTAMGGQVIARGTFNGQPVTGITLPWNGNPGTVEQLDQGGMVRATTSTTA